MVFLSVRPEIIVLNGYLTDTCLTAQDMYKELLKYFRI